MSKSNNGDQAVKDQPDMTPPAGTDNPAGIPELLTIEEHAKNLNIDAPIFAAVMEVKKWGGGKKVPEAVFKAAVKEFINGSMGGA